MLLAQIITAGLGNNKKHILSRWCQDSIFNYLNLNRKTNSLWVKNNKKCAIFQQTIYISPTWRME